MNCLLWILLLSCCGNSFGSGCGCGNSRRSDNNRRSDNSCRSDNDRGRSGRQDSDCKSCSSPTPQPQPCCTERPFNRFQDGDCGCKD